MFGAAELCQRTPRAEFDRIAPQLRTELLELQSRLRDADFPVLLLFAGVDGAGKSETVNLINEWLDPHWIVTHAYDDPSDEEAERPTFWRYWRDLPKRGQIGLFLSGWYSRAILDRVYRRSTLAEFNNRLDHIDAFERTLADDGALILKFWMHLGQKRQKRRLKALEADPMQQWRVGKKDWRNWKRYDQFIAAAETAILRTDNGACRWSIIDGLDSRYRSLTVLNILKQSLTAHLELRAERRAAIEAGRAKRAAEREKELRTIHRNIALLESKAEQALETGEAGGATKTVLSALDLSQSLPHDDYAIALRSIRAELARLSHEARQRGISSLCVFEGWDAAGKGSAIRRLSGGLDARTWQVVPIAAPTDEEAAHHYLWRFWRHLPRAGRLVIFDRSWYGRVLVERVENFAEEFEWQRAYAEINDFEEQLLHHGMVLSKFWLHITPDEQYRRFKEREQIVYKQWKLTDEDWRNRAKWGAYESAVNEMVERTSTRHAPWVLIEGNNKNFARIKILRTYAEQLRRRLAQP
jgi:polyphosphate kinase 2 (PPK2 family)